MNEKAEEFKVMLARGVDGARKRIECEGQYDQISDEARDRALNILSYAVNLPAIWPKTCILLLTMIPKMEMAGHRGDWIPYLEKGAHLSYGRGDFAAHGEFCLAIGYIELLQAKFQSAETWFSSGKQSFSQINDAAGHGRALNRLAQVKLNREDYTGSLELVHKAVTLLDAKDVECANSHYILGSICRAEQDWPNAERHYRTSLSIWQTAQDKRKTAWGMGNLAVVLLQQENYEEAITLCTLALEIFVEVYDPANKAQVQNSLAVAYYECNRIDEANAIFIQARKSFKALGDELGLARTVQNLGLNYSSAEQWASAQIYYRQAVVLWEKLDLIASLCNTLDGLGKTYLATGNHEEAAKIFQEGLAELEKITAHPKYSDLRNMLVKHLEQAEKR